MKRYDAQILMTTLVYIHVCTVVQRQWILWYTIPWWGILPIRTYQTAVLLSTAKVTRLLWLSV